ncbi:conserved hypothetical protein [Methylocella tundrae]|uniref:DUF883 domain-containing protein n=1 Tax=Methylocella tundrae TaxID=227605 RepID=A0A8B6MAM7_METTU|nr:DUF883 family protein [Methylocella tundrae]VTZ21442.1 conserved hypothetical protein [Methylocella tundrae]VTZ51575.1 conserved hypothetical protein [Methylocella tundrae]
MTDTKILDEASQNLSADLAALRDDITKLTASVTKLVKAEASATSDSVYGAVDAARQKLSDSASDAKHRLAGASSDLEATIERNPLIAVLIALATGLIIGLLSRARK